jgi:hypothetical protein
LFKIQHLISFFCFCIPPEDANIVECDVNTDLLRLDQFGRVDLRLEDGLTLRQWNIVHVL